MDSMETASSTEKLPTPWPHKGPTLRSVPNTDLPENLPLCAECPAAWWYRTDSVFECFCSKFRSVVFDKRNGPVTMCDAREEAIKEAPKRPE